jgi:hypothetical protein
VNSATKDRRDEPDEAGTADKGTPVNTLCLAEELQRISSLWRITPGNSGQGLSDERKKRFA